MTKVAFVTGGAKGIGSAIVKRFIKDGYKVVFTYNSSEDKAQALASDLGENQWSDEIFEAAGIDKRLMSTPVPTGTSAGCAVKFGLALVEALKGKDAADAIARQIVIR